MQKNIMKIALIAVLLLSCFIQELKSQNLIDPPKLDSTSSTVIDTDFQDFILGWNWGSPGEKLDDALQINAYHNCPAWSSDIGQDMRGIEVLPGIIASRAKNVVLNAHALYLEPTIIPNPGGEFEPRYGDNFGAVFGWRNVNFEVCDTVSSGRDIHRLLLESDGIDSKVRILDSAWDSRMNGTFRRLTPLARGANESGSHERRKFARNYFLSIS